jgi:nucleoside-diphosphate-sugar epimerase
MTILITGSEGLIGRYLAARLEAEGSHIRRFDIARSPVEDVRNRRAIRRALEGVSGVILLAAVSRVIWAEQDPLRCTGTNVNALEHVLQSCLEQKVPPWVLFASSREVYGDADTFPVGEDAPFKPVNIYARSKVRGEELVRASRKAGLRANICRLSSVYGCPLDHADRVAMAFAGAASAGGRIRLEGSGNIFDFTSVHDVARGLALLVKATAHGEDFPPLHFVSGKGTTLAELARVACSHALNAITVEEAPPRDFDVSRFIGDPARTLALLGWKAETDIHQGLPALIKDLRARRDGILVADARKSCVA